MEVDFLSFCRKFRKLSVEYLFERWRFTIWEMLGLKDEVVEYKVFMECVANLVRYVKMLEVKCLFKCCK